MTPEATARPVINDWKRRLVARLVYACRDAQSTVYLCFTLLLVLTTVFFACAEFTPDGASGIDIGLVFLLLTYAQTKGLPPVIGLTLATFYAMCRVIHVSMLTGGIFAVTTGWLVFMPLSPLFVLGIRHGMAWLLMGLLCLIALASMGWTGYIVPGHQATMELVWWSLSNHIALALSVLVLPLFYEYMLSKSLRQSQQRHQELLLKRAQLLRAQTHKNSFIAALSHEMRTPMNAILGFNDLLQQQLAHNPRAVEVVGLVQQSADHLLTVINDILDYSQMQSGKISVQHEAFELSKTVRSAFELFQQRVASMKIDYLLDMQADLPARVMGDRHRLVQVLVNLLGNALKFTHAGHVTLRVHRVDQSLLFEVEDTGIGIAPERLQSIFHRFEQATPQTASLYGGNGLGLSIGRHLVHLMGGKLGVESRLRVGSRFWFFLPLVVAEPVRPAPVQPALGVAWQDLKLRILVVDDNPVNRLLACQVVASRWPMADVHQSANGAQALDLMRETTFDLVLMDMLMPVMDGITATSLLRTELPHPQCDTPVLGLTANIHTEDHARCLAAGMNDIILKPFDREQLCSRIEGLLIASPQFCAWHGLPMPADRAKAPAVTDGSR